MIRIRRGVRALAVGALLLAAAAPAVRALAQPAAAPAPAAPVWPHQVSDLAPDPQVRFGVLPNGMRYAIRRNAHPPGQLALRLRIAAGAMHEAPDQRGLAHLLEHLAFAGSRNVGEDELFKRLERLGARRGADANAGTGKQSTQFIFNLARSDDESLDTGLMLLREIASELTLSQQAMDDERGVILSEERARASPLQRSSDALGRALYGDHPFARSPIGEAEVLKTAPVAKVRAFYEAYYRPERATLVVVGDVDPAKVEARIRERFADWRGRGPAGPDPPPLDLSGAPPPPQVHVEANLLPAVSLTWLKPYEQRPHNRAVSRERLVESLVTRVLNRRYIDLVQAGEAPFIAAIVASGDVRGVARTTGLATSGATDLAAALEAVLKVQRQALEFGLRQDELDRTLTEIRQALTSQAASAATRRTTGLADALIGSAAGEVVYQSPDQQLAFFEAVAPTVTLEEVNAALGRLFQGRGPVLFAADGKPLPGGEGALAQAYAKALGGPLVAGAQAAAKPWPYTDFGPPGRIAERREAADLGVTFVRFENGVRLTVKPTDFTKDRVQVRLRFGRGELDLPKDRLTPAQAWGGPFIAGGLGRMSLAERQRALAGKSAEIGAQTGADGFYLSGGPRREDLALQLQLLTAYLTDPAWKVASWETQRSVMAQALEAVRSQPAAVFDLHASPMLRSGDMRWSPPTPEFLRALEVAEVKAVLAPILAEAELEVVIVGDVDLETAIAETARTLGALPRRAGRSERAGAREVRFPAPTPVPVAVHHRGRADQGMAGIAWPTTGYWKDPEATVHTRILQLILLDRVQQVMREKLGKTYGVNGQTAFSRTYPDYGLIALRSEVSSEVAPLFFETVEAAARDLKQAGPSQDEVARVVGPQQERLARAYRENGFWISNLGGAHEDPRVLDDLRTGRTMLAKVTPASVRAAAQRWLVPERAWRMTVTPAAPANP